MAELKKCPFCGGEAIIDREDIFCDNCHLSMRIDDRKYNGEAETYEEAREQAIEAWNNRATEAEIRTKVIDEFAEELKWEYENSIGISQREINFAKAVIDQVAERLKENERHE